MDMQNLVGPTNGDEGHTVKGQGHMSLQHG